MPANPDTPAGPPRTSDGSGTSQPIYGTCPTWVRRFGSLVLVALPAGAITGLAEVAWTYAMPAFNPLWRATLPGSITGLLWFLLAAVTIDGLVALAVALVLRGVVPALLRSRAARQNPPSNRIDRWLVTTAMTAYLVVGWLLLFVMSPRDKTAARLAVTLTLIVIACGVAAGVATRIASWVRRRSRYTWLPQLAAAATAFAFLVPAYHRYTTVLERQTPIVVTSPPGTKPVNVLLITLDTLRADYLGCYGNTWIKTPTLDAVAREAVVFEQAISQAPSTTPSHASIMTSTYPFDHGAENGRPIRPGLVTLADLLSAAGYETIAFTSATTTRSINSGLDQGFGRYVDSLIPWSEWFSHDEFQNLILFYLLGVAQRSTIPGEVVSRRAVHWLDHRDPHRPFFCWLHYFDPHAPYGSPQPFAGMYDATLTDDRPMRAQRRAYAEDVSYTDAQVATVLRKMRDLGAYDRSLIVITSDHGEAFGERHGETVEVGHGRYLYDTTQHVPLIVKPPVRTPPARVGDQVELIDLAPTIADVLGLNIPDAFTGVSFKALLSGAPRDHSRAARSFNVTRRTGGGPARRALYVQQLSQRVPPYKYITIPRTGLSELYDLSRDPAESRNIVTRLPEVAQRIHDELVRYWQSSRDPTVHPGVRLAPALVKQLQTLGYLSDVDDSGDRDNTPAP